MSIFEDVAIYLPKHLSSVAARELLEQVGKFPANDSGSYYTDLLAEIPSIFQGDCLTDMPVANLPSPRIGHATCIVLSNTCDLDPENERLFSSAICYAPIIRYERYRDMLARRQLEPPAKLESHLTAIRNQSITQALFLPRHGRLDYDGIVFLDRICHCANDCVERSALSGRRIVTLSDFGAYLFALKISIHFTRLTDRVNRSRMS